MTQSREESPLSRIELVVLACLSQSKAPSDAELGDAVRELALPDESAEVARRRALELLAEFVRRAWVTPDDAQPRGRGARRAEPRRKLTEDGRRALRTAFQLSRAPTWAQVRDKRLPSLALGLTPGSEQAEKACTETALVAAVLGARFGVRGATTPMAVCDALIADALGMPRGPLTLDRLRAHVLARGIDTRAPGAPSPSSKGYAGKLAAWIAASAIGASGTYRNKTARAITRRYVCGEAHPLGVPLTLVTTVKAPTAPVPVTSPQVSTNLPTPPAGPGSTTPTRADERKAQQAAAGGSSPGVPGGTEGAPPLSPPPVPPDGAKPQPPAQNLLDVVREAIPRIGAEGRFGEKVYVSAIWRTIERDRKAGDLSLDHFKRWLLRANRDGWLVLARADLVGAMDAKQVTESEINDRGATFHFVLDQRNGGSAHRGSHAR